MSAFIERIRKDPGVAWLVLALVCATVLYATSLTRGLIALDDPWLIGNNWIVQDASWSSVRTLFFDLDSPRRFTLAPEYLPIRDLSVMLDFAIWGDWYGGFHLTNLLLYLAAIVIWFRVLVSFGIERSVAGLALLLWALHPTHAESVAWLSERKGLLGVIFAGACGLGYARFRAGRGIGWLWLALAMAVCAVWSKAIAAFAIAALAGLELVLPSQRVSWKRSLSGLAAIAVVGALAFVPVLMLATSSSVVGTEVRAPAGRIEMVLGVHGFYLRLGAMSMRNAISYPISSDGPSAFEIAIGALGLAAAIACAVVRARRLASAPALQAGAALWLFGWLPVSHLILPLQMVFVADRYMLLPTLGLALAIAVLVYQVGNVRIRSALLAAICLAAALRTLDAQSNWSDSSTLWHRAVTSNPHDGEAWSFYAEAVAASDRPERAFDVIAEGLTHSRAPRLIMRQALLVLEHGNPAEGLALMRRAAEGGEPRAMSNLALLLLEEGKLEEALRWARRSVELAPHYVNGRRLLGKIALAAGQGAEALEAFSTVYGYEPKKPANRFNLALALIALRRNGEARSHLDACVADPQLGLRARALLADLPP